jgi:hypothetical protein
LGRRVWNDAILKFFRRKESDMETEATSLNEGDVQVAEASVESDAPADTAAAELVAAKALVRKSRTYVSAPFASRTND